MFRYQAPNPYSSNTSFSSLTSFSSSKSIGKLVLPAQWREPTTFSKESLARFAQENALMIQGGYIATHDGALLDSIELKPLAEAKNKPSERYYIVKFNGNGMQYQDALKNYANDANRLSVSIVGFNYRGVGNSTKAPATFGELVTDGIAQVQRLLDSGVKSKHVTLDGLSLGGGVATMVAKHFHLKGLPVYLWNDRSFASISRAAAGMVAPESSEIFGNSSFDTLASSSWVLTNPLQWEVDAAKAYDSIPAEYKGHMYVAKKSQKSYGDGVIDDRASLHQGVKKHEKKHGIQTGHKFFAQSGRFGGGHNMQRADLVSAENQKQSAQDVFETFVKSHR